MFVFSLARSSRYRLSFFPLVSAQVTPSRAPLCTAQCRAPPCAACCAVLCRAAFYGVLAFFVHTRYRIYDGSHQVPVHKVCMHFMTKMRFHVSETQLTQKCSSASCCAVRCRALPCRGALCLAAPCCAALSSVRAAVVVQGIVRSTKRCVRVYL